MIPPSGVANEKARGNRLPVAAKGDAHAQGRDGIRGFGGSGSGQRCRVRRPGRIALRRRKRAQLLHGRDLRAGRRQHRHPRHRHGTAGRVHRHVDHRLLHHQPEGAVHPDRPSGCRRQDAGVHPGQVPHAAGLGRGGGVLRRLRSHAPAWSSVLPRHRPGHGGERHDGEHAGQPGGAHRYRRRRPACGRPSLRGGHRRRQREGIRSDAADDEVFALRLPPRPRHHRSAEQSARRCHLRGRLPHLLRRSGPGDGGDLRTAPRPRARQDDDHHESRRHDDDDDDARCPVVGPADDQDGAGEERWHARLRDRPGHRYLECPLRHERLVAGRQHLAERGHRRSDHRPADAELGRLGALRGHADRALQRHRSVPAGLHSLREGASAAFLYQGGAGRLSEPGDHGLHQCGRPEHGDAHGRDATEPVGDRQRHRFHHHRDGQRRRARAGRGHSPSAHPPAVDPGHQAARP